jgi:RHS repeat-associated protein
VKTPFSTIASFILCSATMFGQAPQSTAPQGVPYENHGLYSIDLQDMSLVFNIPIRTKPGFSASFVGAADRVGLDTGANGLSTGYLMPIELNPYGTGVPGATTGIAVNGMIGPNARIENATVTTSDCGGAGTQMETYSNWYVEDASGTVHPFSDTDYVNWMIIDHEACTHATFTDVTLDFQYKATVTISYNSSTKVTSYTAQVWANDGSTSGVVTWGNPILTWKDKNGNVSSANSTFTSWKDPMNGIAPLTSSTGISASPSYSWTDIAGGTQTVSFSSTANSIKTSYGCASPYEDLTGTAVDLVTSVSFPDGSSLGIAYEPNGSGYTTGRVSELTLPTGGTVSLAYLGFNCAYAVPTEMTMTTTDGTWTYTWAPLSYGSGTTETYGNTVTVKDPAGNYTVHTYIGLGATNAGTNSFGVFEVERQTFAAGSSTAGVTVATCYNGNSSNCISTAPLLPISEIYTATLLSGMTTSQQHYQTFDAYGDVLTDTLYDFSGTYYNESKNTFNATASCSSNTNAPSLLCTTESLYTGTEVAARMITYDASGDALTINSYLPGNTTITTTNTYNSNGTLKTSLSPGGVTTTNTYGDCNGFGLTQSAVSSTLYVSYTYGSTGCDGGVPVTKTDSNGNVTNLYYADVYGADPWYRQRILVDPLGDEFYHDYTPTSSTQYLAFGSSEVAEVTALDGYGRRINMQRYQSPSGGDFDTTSFTYSQSTTGGLGATRAESIPCVAASGASCATGFTTGQYDYLGRTSTARDGDGGVFTYTYNGNDTEVILSPAPSGENTKAVLTEFNGLWTTIICPIVTSTLPAGSSCGTSLISGTGYPKTFGYTAASGNRTYTEILGSQTHTKVVDSLGRSVSETYPESGTTKYYYDAQSPHGCSTSNGRLTEKDDAKGNELCYTYDTYGRISKVAANGTMCRLFYYDNSTGFSGTIPNGPNGQIVITNPYGHMVEAATSDCLTTLLTDEWFSYDTLGHVVNTWQRSPHSTVSGTGPFYYQVSDTYYPNGVPNVETFAGIDNSNTVITYGVDGEGRWSSAQIGAANEITSVAYTAAGQPSLITFPSGEVNTTTSASIAPHATTFTVTSTSDIVPQQMLNVDTNNPPGQQEQVLVESVSGNTVTINGLGFRRSHNSGVPVASQHGDEDVYTYSATTGRMTGFVIWSDESGGELTGQLNWNVNGSLASFNRIDSINTSGSQDCTFIYDDLSRVASDLCGTGSTNYRSMMTYDQYNNITKTSSNGTAPTWPLSGTYSATTNQLSSSTYDANGSTLTDYFHTYAWDGFNRMAALDSNSNMIYDAFGRPIEVNVGGLYEVFEYSPAGAKIVWMGSNQWAVGLIPMPGGTSADWSPSGVYMNHNDWRGSSPIVTTAGAVYADKAFGAYGEDTPQNFGGSAYTFETMQQTIEIGVYDTPNREYMPSQSRWPSVDSAHDSWNGYSYPTNPISQADPSGEICLAAPAPCPHSQDDSNDSTGSPDEGPSLLSVYADTNGGLYCCTSWYIPNDPLVGDPGRLVPSSDMDLGASTVMSNGSAYVFNGDTYLDPVDGQPLFSQAAVDGGAPQDSFILSGVAAPPPISQYLSYLVFRPWSGGVQFPFLNKFVGPAFQASVNLSERNPTVCGGGVGALGSGVAAPDHFGVAFRTPIRFSMGPVSALTSLRRSWRASEPS